VSVDQKFGIRIVVHFRAAAFTSHLLLLLLLMMMMMRLSLEVSNNSAQIKFDSSICHFLLPARARIL